MDHNSTSPLFPTFHPALDTSGCDLRIPELIAKRAYDLFEKRGRQETHELEDWLEAEREIKRHLGIE